MAYSHVARGTVVAAAVACLLTAAPTAANAFQTVESVDDFVRIVAGREMRRFGITVSVAPQGAIEGRAFGSDVSGQWRWENGFFCRDLYWGGDDLGYNCQLVQVEGDTIRFTTDRGAGIYADLTLR